MPYEPLAGVAGFIHVCGHRGHSIGAPENTIPALEAAAAHGASVCEIDVVLGADGEIVVIHDEVLDRTTDARGRVAARGMDELRRLDAGAWFDPRFAGTGLPSLGEALAAARRLGLGLLVEIKERQRTDMLIERLAALLEQADALDEILAISFNHPSLIRAQARIPGLRTELITHARHIDPAGMARRAGATSVAIEAYMFHPDDAVALHAAGIAVRVTIPRPERIALRRGHGLDPLALVEPALRDGLIDVLAGDDVRALRALVDATR
ncbi:MAG: glycerophosphodiester phosphodiesterase [Alphaproteobacteria bacterium]|nr:glycerophosphodiester phosphodiesterase [Alphaproteobacteria bacterium]